MLARTARRTLADTRTLARLASSPRPAVTRRPPRSALTRSLHSNSPAMAPNDPYTAKAQDDASPSDK